MQNNSKTILLWGLKILAERYWRQPLAFDFDTALLEKVCRFLPQSEKLLQRLSAGYLEEENSPRLALQSIFTRVQLFPDRQLSAAQFLPPVFNFDRLNQPLDQMEIAATIFAENHFDFSSLSQSSESELLLNVLHKYGGFLPALNEPNCTMPLYEYFKIAAALATNPEGDFRLVVGDLSGIQDFIYTISSERALKVLRARSFYLELLIKALAHEIIDDLELTSANILYAGGGNFLLLLPELPNLDKKITSYYQAINNHFLQRFEGRLHAPFASVRLCNAEIAESKDQIIREQWNRLFEKELTKEKNRKFHGMMKELIKANNGESNEMMQPYEVDRASCEICHADEPEIKLTEIEGSKYCEFCQRLEHVGRTMHKDRQISVARVEKGKFDKAAFSALPFWPFGQANQNHERSFRLNAIAEDATPIMFYCNHVSKASDGAEAVATFEEMARGALGTERLATLAMDVDNMSTVFRGGIQTEDPRQHLIYAPTLSRLLDYFFKPGLKWICQNPEFRVASGIKDLPPKLERNLSVIYSGGDDLLLAGGWDDVAEVAIDIQKNFKRFTCGNSDMGISAGMYVSTAGFPFYISVSKAKEAENKFAKANHITIPKKERSRYADNPLFDPHTGQLKKKDSAVFFYDELNSFMATHSAGTMKERYLLAAKWPEVEESILAFLQKFVNPSLAEFKDGKLEVRYSRGFIGKLHALHEKYLHEPEAEIYLPDLVYHYARLERRASDLLKSVYRHLADYDHNRDKNPIHYLPVVLSWLELLLREKGE